MVDVGGSGAGKLFLGFLGLLADALHGDHVAGQVDAVLAGKLFQQPVGHPVVKVVAAQVVVAAGGQHLHHAVADLDQRNVKGAAAQVVDHHLLGAAVVQAVGQRGGGGLVDDAPDVQPGDAPGVLGGLALRVVEVGGHRDDRLGDRLAQVDLGVGLEFLQDLCADLLGRILPPVDGDAGILAHFALDAADRAARVGDRLPLGRGAHQALAVVGECHHRRRGALALRVGDDHRLAALDNSDAAVCRTQVDSDDFAHTCNVLSQKQERRGPCRKKAG